MGWVVSVTPRPRFTPGERTGTHWIGGWVGPRADLDAGARRKICPCRGSNLDRPIVQPVVRHYTAWATATHQNSSCIKLNFMWKWVGVRLSLSLSVRERGARRRMLRTILLKYSHPHRVTASSTRRNTLPRITCRSYSMGWWRLYICICIVF
jgi:hypothetical protein